MTKKITFFIAAALMLLTMMATTGQLWGQTKITDYSNIVSGNTYYIGATTGDTDYYLYVYHDNNSPSTAGTAQTSMNDATTFVFEGSGTSWTLKFDNGKYLSLKDGKDNGKVQVVADPATFTTSNQSGKIRLSKGSYSVQKNNSTTNFGSYANTQTDIWLMEVPSSLSLTTVTIDDSGITNTDVYVNTEAGSLSATVKDDENNSIDGATVTWTSSATGIATIDADGEVTLVSAGKTTITASYAGNSTYSPSFSTYELTVTSSEPYNQPTTIEITPNYTFWGKADSFSGSTYDELSGSKDNVTLDWTRGGGSTYANLTAMRFYKENNLTFTAPTGYEIKSIVITFTTAKDDLSFSPEGYSLSETTGTWTGSAETVTMSRPANASSYAQISQYVITVGAASNLLTVTYDANGATSGSVPTDSNEYESGAEVTVLGNTGTLAKAGYVWAGWNTKADGTGTDRAEGSKFNISENTTLYAKWDAKTITTLTYSGTPTATQYAGQAFNPAGLTVTATFNDASQEDVTSQVVWTPNQLTIETTSVTGTYMGLSVVVEGITVTYAPGTQDNPYTVAQARAAIDAGTGVTNVYATGIVSEIVTPYNSQYGNISYNISTDGLTTSDQLQSYRGKSYNGENFTSDDDIQVGDIVVVYGNLTKYNSTYEFAANNQLVSLIRKVANPTFSPMAGAVAAGTEVTIACVTTGATIYYTTDGTDPTISSSVYSEPIVINAAMTIKAFAHKDGSPDSDIVTAEYTIAAPVAKPTFLPAGSTYNYAQSVVIECTTEGATIYYTTDGNDPTTESTEYTEAIVVNETMTIKAIGAKAGLANSEVASATYTMNIPVINASNVNLAYDATNGSIAYTLTNEVEGGVLTAVRTEGDWLTVGEVSAESVALTCTANEGEADRTATVTLTYNYETHTVTKVVTVTQAHFIIDYAELPFKFNGGKADIENTFGLTQNGLGSNYSSSPKLKFDDTGDWVILKINETPGKLTFDIKNNSFSGGTFTVQTSEDGVTYTNLENYTTITGTQNEEFTNLGENIRYIKWIYTKKVSGNVGLGNIALAQYTVPVPSISADDVAVAYDATSGSIMYTINNYVAGTMVATTEADWISDFTYNQVDEIGEVGFTTAANTGAERSATVTLTYSYGDPAATVTKDVTVTQNAAPAPTFTVSFAVGDGGTFVPNDDFDDEMVEVEAGTYTLPSATKEGYTFDGWNDGEQTYAAGASYEVSDNVVFTATYTALPTYTVSFWVNGDIDNDLTETGSSISLPTTSARTPDGFAIYGWALQNSIEAVANPYVPTANVILYALLQLENTPTVLEKYVKVTEELTDWSGEYLIAYSDNIFADGRIGGTGENGIGALNVSVDLSSHISNNTISRSIGDSYKVTLEEISEGSKTYVLKTQDGKYNYQTSNNNGLLATKNKETAASYPISVTFTSENDIKLCLGGNATGAVFRYNTSGYFRYYKNGGQNAVYLYKKVSETVTPTIVNVESVYGTTSMPDNIPESTCYVVEDGAVLTFTGTNEGTAANLVVQEGGQLIHTADVEATVQKSVSGYTNKSGNGWYLISSPVDKYSTSTIATGTYDLFIYNEPNAYWYSSTGAAAPFNTLERGKGYLYANAAYVNLNYAGTMKATNANITVDLSFECDEYSGLKGFNLVGNPFTRNITAADMAIGETEVISYYDFNNERTEFVTYRTDERPIQPGQGFFIQATGNAQQLEFNPASSKDASDFKYISISAGDENFTDKAYIQFGGGNTLRKMTFGENTMVYVMNNDDDYAAARVEELAGTMPVHFVPIEDGFYTITVETKNIENLNYMHLIDNIKNTEIDLLVEPSYTFKASESDNADRFYLVFDFNNYTNVEESFENSHFAYQFGDELILNGNGTLQVFDIMGRFVMSREINGSERISTTALNAGVYVLRLNDNIQKIVVR